MADSLFFIGNDLLLVEGLLSVEGGKMKLLALALLIAELFIVAINVPGKPNQAANDKHTPTQNKSPAASTTNPPEHSSKTNQDKREGNAEPTKWYTALKRAEWWLVIAAFATLLVVGWQSYETMKAAQATLVSTVEMRKSIKLQEAALRQWVEIELLGSKHRGALFEPSGEIKQSVTVEIRLQAINTTPLPLTIKRVVTKISRRIEGREPQWEVFEVEEREILPPKREGKGITYPFYVAFDVVGAAVKSYQMDQLLVSVASRIFFESASGAMEEQSFASLVKCGPHREITILPYIGKEPGKSETGDQDVD